MKFTVINADGAAIAHLDLPKVEYVDLWLERAGHQGCQVVEGHLPLAEPETPTEALWDMVRSQRNKLLALHGWTVAPHSPLSASSRAEWLSYLQALQAVTKDLADPKEVQWPEPPTGYEYD